MCCQNAVYQALKKGGVETDYKNVTRQARMAGNPD